MIKLSVVICTYNPNQERLDLTINSLKMQDFPLDDWELVLVNNNSTNKVLEIIDLNWTKNGKIVKEEKLGLTYARLKGFNESKGDLIVMVDDDNILEPNYLSFAFKIYTDNQTLGAFGGKSIPLFDAKPPIWIYKFHGNLALRDLGNVNIIQKWNNSYPMCAPIGAGMCIRKASLITYINKIRGAKDVISDRIGNSLSSGGDNDIIFEILKSNWDVGYFPILSLKHIIPQDRVKVEYLARLVFDTNKSWIKLLESHSINPWRKIPRWSVPFRKFKKWMQIMPINDPVKYIKWKEFCGMYEGLSEI